MSLSKTVLSQLTGSVQERFVDAQTILSFDEYIEALYENAPLFCRNASQYLFDAIEHFGSEQVKEPTGNKLRYNIFHRSNEAQNWVAGQEAAQAAIIKTISNFVRDGQSTRMLLLHGPNGSGKSSLIASLIESLEHYSQEPSGLLYRFNWIFPNSKLKRSDIGFSASESQNKDFHSYAHLNGDQIDARLPSPLKDHPLLLLPKAERHQLFGTLFKQKKLPKNFQVSQYLKEGELSSQNRKIFDALMAHYGGNFSEVLQHVQVERYYISRRYSRSVASIEPQMHVDASARQITADRSLSSLPKYLTNLNLMEPYGALVDSNRGILEFSDLLKRPPEAFKYLLGTCETSRVTVPPIILFLDIVMLGSANELNLDRFKESPAFMSFKSRLELIRVPYLLNYKTEQKIYDALLERSNLSKKIAPHLTYLASLWAILTRIKYPDPKSLPKVLEKLITTITPLEKAKLYTEGKTPQRLDAEQAKKLKQHITTLYEESQNSLHYEGRIGASPREMRMVLFNAAQNPDYPSVSPLALFEELEKLVKEDSVYTFLQLEPKDRYYDPAGFIQYIKSEYLELLDQEFRAATGLVSSGQHSQLLILYVKHIKAYLQKEKVENPITKVSEEPNQSLMESVEESLLGEKESPKEFRQNFLSKIAAHSLENPSQSLDIPNVFADQVQQLEKDFFLRQRGALEKITTNCLILLLEEKNGLSEKEQKEATETIQYLTEQYNYPKESLKNTLSLLLRRKYQEQPEIEKKPEIKKKSETKEEKEKEQEQEQEQEK